MLTRATRHVFWWHLSCALVAMERVEAVSVVPVFPGEIVYFLVDAEAVYSAVSGREDEEARGGPDARRASRFAKMPSRRACSVILLAIRVLTLIVALLFLLFHRRMYVDSLGSPNCTSVREE